MVDVSSPYIAGVRELPVKPAHFAERFALFVIITLGESIVSIGSLPAFARMGRCWSLWRSRSC